MNRFPDVEAIFEFNGTRKSPIKDGYRPAHLINDTYLATGIHHYNHTEWVQPNATVRGTITFLTPNAYTRSLWIGKKINIQEGERIVGHATIISIFNTDLAKDKNN